MPLPPDHSRRTLRSAADLGEFLRAVRIASNLRQSDAAALCGVSAPFLIALEHGKPTVRLDAVLKVCAGLGVSVELEAPVALSERAPRSLKHRPKRLKT
jgi:HTH-type transcriptional regulator / antitoxin HipB